MVSRTLWEARRYEEATEKLLDAEERPDFHLAVRVGWMNDPNGFSWYQGQYHMFYQYYPYAPFWGPMHWGHAVSSDLLHWSYLPAVLAPDQIYDRDGCFSGSAVELADGRQLLMYTGVLSFPQADGGKKDTQTQCVAVGNGIDYEKYEGNPVIAEDLLPEGASTSDFRDPKIMRMEDGSYRCIVANRAQDGSGQILLFESPDAFHWTYKKILLENKNRFGKMWECPDMFPLDGKMVFLTSPQDMMPQGFEYHNGNGTLCLIGSYDEETDTFTEEHDQTIDYGIDFYAPQTVQMPDGRRVMIGWMQNWDTCTMRGIEDKWFGQMSLPRELFIQDGRLYQRPLRELEQYRKNKVVCQNVLAEDVIRLPGVHGRKVDMEISVRPDDPEHVFQKFTVRFAQNDTYQTAVSFRPQEQVVKVDRKFSGSRRAIIHQRRCKVEGSADGRIRMRIILDQCSAEIFINDGRQVMTITLYTEKEAEGISFYTIGKARMDLVKYDLVL